MWLDSGYSNGNSLAAGDATWRTLPWLFRHQVPAAQLTR